MWEVAVLETLLLYIEDGGNIGIGTDNPGRLLSLFSASGDPFLSLKSNSSNTPGILFGDTDSDSIGQIRYYNNGNFFSFETNGGERLRITSTGRIHQFGNNEDISMDASSSGQLMLDGNGYNFGIAMGSNHTAIYHNSSSRALVFGTNEIERMRIMGDDGDVGIGTDNPTSKLSVEGGGQNIRIGEVAYSGYAGIVLNGSTTNADYNLLSRSNDKHLFINRLTSANIYFRMNNNDQAILTDAGRFGLGTISPVATLHVEGTISQTGIEQPNIKPVVDFNFAATKVLDHRIDFRRNSVGTYHDSLGRIQYALKDTPRFDHDPATGESLGLLVEESRSNNLGSINSREFNLDHC